MEHRDLFLSQIAQHISNLKEEKFVQDNDRVIEGRDIDVCIRARPLLTHELQSEFFEVVHS